MLSFVLPTHNRPVELARTLARLGALDGAIDAEVIVVDNASVEPVSIPCRLANGWRALTLLKRTNVGAAARNDGVRLASGRWVIMLDDDSHPLDLGFIDAIKEAAPDVAAIGAEILLPGGKHESGGLPEVIVGCGAAIRRDVFLEVGGYDPAFHFYAEEYDLCAKLIRAGHRVIVDARFRVLHEKTPTGRDMNIVLARLMRNNGWVVARYAPTSGREAALSEVIARYAVIAKKERALAGYEAGLAELDATIAAQPRTPMSLGQWERFTGCTAARFALEAARDRIESRRVSVVASGKGAAIVESLVVQLGGTLVDGADAESLVIGTLSPGPLLDAMDAWTTDARPVIAPWDVRPTLMRRAG
ncbi:MAG: glycosyltransferase [Phycisphaerae bacterium]|nr:glycosyltransferase [Phycisphaerae bacterium]